MKTDRTGVGCGTSQYMWSASYGNRNLKGLGYTSLIHPQALQATKKNLWKAVEEKLMSISNRSRFKCF